MNYYVNKSVSADCATTDDNIALAKSVDALGAKVYFIKVYTYDHKPVNPIDVNLHSMKLSTKNGQDVYKWQKVSKTVFDGYVKFLETEKQGFFLFAERELING